MNDSIPDFIRELLWRRNLTAEESATLADWLARHPQMRDVIEEEQALNAAIERLPEAALPSNFTARVLAALDHQDRKERAASSRPVEVWRWISGWLPRVAAVGLLVVVSMLGWHQHRVTSRAELASSLAERVVTLGPEVVENFDTVRRFAGAKPDLELLKAMSE